MEYKNFSKGVLAAELLDTGTSLTITTTETFPTTGQFKAVIWDAGETEPQNDSTREIMTLEWNGSEYDIVGREQEDTAAKTWAEGSNIAHIVTAEQYDGFEVTDNKTTSFQATPDDTKYPTEKLVKDSLDNLVPYTGASSNVDLGANMLTTEGLLANDYVAGGGTTYYVYLDKDTSNNPTITFNKDTESGSLGFNGTDFTLNEGITVLGAARYNATTDMGATDTDFSSKKYVDDEVATKAETANAMGSINHGADENTARPTGYYSITWIGESEPQNAEDNDIWINTT